MSFIHAAGWGIWPVLLFSAIALGLAARHAIRPSRQLVPLIVGFSIATLIAGALGTVTGLQHAVAPLFQIEADRRWIFLLGLGEALNNMVASLIAVMFVSFGTMIGSYRLATATRSNFASHSITA